MSLPKEILFEKYAEIGFFWQGQVPSGELLRLSENLDKSSTLDVVCRLQKKDGIIWLEFGVAGELCLSCHRCLSPMLFDVSGEYRTAILMSESQISLIESADYLLYDEFGENRYLPIVDLLEDELLLLLPLSSTHTDCEPLLDTVGEIAEESKESPFAILGQLKLKN